MADTLVQELSLFASDHEWVDKNLEGLIQRYAEQWIAVRNRQVVAAAPDIEGLRAKVPDLAHICVEFVTREPLEMVL